MSERAFPVHFTDPGPWERLAAKPNHWQLSGRGEIVLGDDTVVLRGRSRKLFRNGPMHEVEIESGRIENVQQLGNVVAFSVTLAGSRETSLALWAADEAAAREIARHLPQHTTQRFELLKEDRRKFEAALQSIGTRSVVTPVLVALNVIVFAASVLAGAGLVQSNPQVLVEWGSNFGPRTLDGESWRLFTSMFLHFGLMHLAFNMWALWSLGGLAERLFGSVHFALLYLVAGLCGSVASLLWHSSVNSAGASGAIFGVLGAFLAFMLNPATRIPASVAAAERAPLFAFAAFNLVYGFIHPGIDNAAHIGGLLGGALMGWVLARPLDPRNRTDPLPRLAVAALIGATVLYAASWPLFHAGPQREGRLQFNRQVQHFLEREQHIEKQQGELDSLRALRRITDEEWGTRVRNEILPQWTAVEEELLAQKDSAADSDWAIVREALLDYVPQRRLALELFADAARDTDRDKLEWARTVQKHNEERVRQLKKLIG